MMWGDPMSSRKGHFSKGQQVLSMLERVRRCCDSAGLKMVTMFAYELAAKTPYGERSVAARGAISGFDISVTVLSAGMDKILLRRSSRGKKLPRVAWGETGRWMRQDAIDLAMEISGDAEVEETLLGRALAVELWDDDEREIRVGFNFLFVSRGMDSMAATSEWEFVPFEKINLEQFDSREALVLSEALSLMGIENPYDNNEAAEEFQDRNHFAA